MEPIYVNDVTSAGALSGLKSHYATWDDLIRLNSTFFAPVAEDVPEYIAFLDDEADDFDVTNMDSAPSEAMCDGDCAACQEDDEEYDAEMCPCECDACQEDAEIETEENRSYINVDSECTLVVVIDDQEFVMGVTAALALAEKLDWALTAAIKLDEEL